ncbi:MAG: MBL fold metallo-hydrolase [Prevotella sp.]|jgi:L-ascorbate metabolism protein UlaG (beta-lactamase superfamily)|nr:MBL fold metallo-hydrolase [Prevotella sp.]
MKLTYIYHSGYAIEADSFTIIIDYFNDSSDNPDDGVVYGKLLKKNGRLYVLSTHSHPDHFNKEILTWKQEHPDIIYIFSKDILEYGKANEHDAIYLDKSDLYRDEMLSVQAFGSTDLGVSFLIKTEGKMIFHAGDLNNWHWNEESTHEEIDEAENFYKNELAFLASKVKHLDLAMFPVDPRLGKDYMKGAEQFISAIKVDVLAPMHFGDEYDKAAAIKGYADKMGCKLISWKKRGESILF